MVTGILYGCDIGNGGICYSNCTSFETDNSKRCISWNCIGMGLVIYYISLVMILEGIGNGNVIWFAITIETIIVVVGVLGYRFVLGIL